MLSAPEPVVAFADDEGVGGGHLAKIPSVTGKFRIVQISLNPPVTEVDIRRLKQPRAEIVIFVGHVSRAKQDVTGLRLYSFIADREQGVTNANNENLVIGMNVPARAYANLSVAYKKHGHVRADVLAFELALPETVVGCPVSALENDGFTAAHGVVSMSLEVAGTLPRVRVASQKNIPPADTRAMAVLGH